MKEINMYSGSFAFAFSYYTLHSNSYHGKLLDEYALNSDRMSPLRWCSTAALLAKMRSEFIPRKQNEKDFVSVGSIAVCPCDHVYNESIFLPKWKVSIDDSNDNPTYFEESNIEKLQTKCTNWFGDAIDKLVNNSNFGHIMDFDPKTLQETAINDDSSEWGNPLLVKVNQITSALVIIDGNMEKQIKKLKSQILHIDKQLKDLTPQYDLRKFRVCAIGTNGARKDATIDE